MLGLPVAVVSGLLTLVFGIAALRQASSSKEESELVQEASRLAGAVRKREEATLALLLADTGDVRSVEVRFERCDAVPARKDGGERTGSSLWIADYFKALSRGRLVIVGPAGSGKTVLAIRLTCELAKDVQLAGASAQERVPSSHTVIPVRVSAPAFGSVLGTSDLDQMMGSQLSDCLDSWLIDQLTLDYGVPRKHATVLVGRGWVMPVLDGVDEMDGAGTVPRRAAALIAATNHPTERGARAAVLTCRTETYVNLGSAQSAYLGERDVLQDATTIEVQPLLASAVRDYLQARFPDPAGSDCGDPRWRPVVARLSRSNRATPCWRSCSLRCASS